jgi:ethanolamine ammonia-lyase small subunit
MSRPSDVVLPPAQPPRSVAELRLLTPARVAIGRSGASLPTSALLDFTLDHARARDAVHAPFDASAVAGSLGALGLRTVEVASRAGSRGNYLRRPDLGRRLDEASAQRLAGAIGSEPVPLALVIGDGLSPTAIHAHAAGLVRELVPRLEAAQIATGFAVVASAARVALGDEIGAMLNASMVVVLIGERPGLSAPDSLGAYITLAPRIGRTDADRNCVSNIHREGLTYEEAAYKIAWLIGEGLARGITGVGLKDESGDARLQGIAGKSCQA